MNPMYLFLIPPVLVLLGAGYLYYRLDRISRMMSDMINVLEKELLDEAARDE